MSLEVVSVLKFKLSVCFGSWRILSSGGSPHREQDDHDEQYVAITRDQTQTLSSA